MSIPAGFCQCGCGRKTNIMPVNCKSQGWVKGQPFKFIRGHNNLSHGFSTRGQRTPEHEAYLRARGRCNNPKDKAYAYYGGRGIEFRFTSFRAFLDALKTLDNPTGRRPSMSHSLDRIAPDGHYEAGNIRWALKKTQSRNTRLNRTNTSGFRGVSFMKATGTWRAYINVNNKQVGLGCCYPTAEAAAVAYDSAALELHGDDAKLNFLGTYLAAVQEEQ